MGIGIYEQLKCEDGSETEVQSVEKACQRVMGYVLLLLGTKKLRLQDIYKKILSSPIQVQTFSRKS